MDGAKGGAVLLDDVNGLLGTFPWLPNADAGAAGAPKAETVSFRGSPPNADGAPNADAGGTEEAPNADVGWGPSGAPEPKGG